MDEGVKELDMKDNSEEDIQGQEEQEEEEEYLRDTDEEGVQDLEEQEEEEEDLCNTDEEYVQDLEQHEEEETETVAKRLLNDDNKLKFEVKIKSRESSNDE